MGMQGQENWSSESPEMKPEVDRKFKSKTKPMMEDLRANKPPINYELEMRLMGSGINRKTVRYITYA